MKEFFMKLVGEPYTTQRIIAVIISFFGYSLFSVAAAVKRKRQVLYVQSTANTTVAIAEGMIGAWSGMVQDIMNLIRNIIVLTTENHRKLAKVLNIIFVFVCGGVGIGVFIYEYFNVTNIDYSPWWRLLPVFATVQFSIVIIIPNVKIPVIKCSIIVTSTCWAIYGIIVKLYTATFFNSLSIITSIISIILYYVRENKQKAINEVPVEQNEVIE